MTRTLLLAPLALAFLGACDGGDTEDTDIATCQTQVAMYPEVNASRVYYRTTVEASFTPEIPADATLTVDGVTGTTETMGRRLVFTPDTPLTPGQAYAATVAYTCGGEAKENTANWTVSEVGAPTTLTDLTGNSYALDLGNARFTEPEGIGSLLGSLLTVDLLIAVESIEDPNITMFGAIGVEGESGVQEPCSETIAFPTADISDNPYFELGPQEFTVTVEDTEVTIDNLFLSGSFAPDGSYIDGAVLSGTVDTRPFKTLVNDDPDAPDDAVCEMAASLGAGVECIDCPDGTGKFCLSLVADSIAAEALETPIRRIDDPCDLEECAAEPECSSDQ